MRRSPFVGIIGLVVALAAGAAAPAAAQLGAPSLTNASSATESAGSGCKYARRSSVATTGSSPSSFSTRYIATVAADNDSPFLGTCSQRIETLATNYTVNFTATAPRLYRLTVATTRNGDINTRDDGGGANNDARADQGAVGCSLSNSTTVSGGCTLADPGPEIIGGNNNQAYNSQTNTLVACGVSNGAPVNHALNFTWTQSACSTRAAPGNADEAAVRLGDDFGLGSETASDYSRHAVAHAGQRRPLRHRVDHRLQQRGHRQPRQQARRAGGAVFANVPHKHVVAKVKGMRAVLGAWRRRCRTARAQARPARRTPSSRRRRCAVRPRRARSATWRRTARAADRTARRTR
ncbi:MAG: hypothetical protein U0802_04200 [Candidatus Binatia bacterium]